MRGADPFLGDPVEARDHTGSFRHNWTRRDANRTFVDDRWRGSGEVPTPTGRRVRDETVFDRAARARLHADRAPGGHRGHRPADRAALARRAGGAGGGASVAVRQQPQAARPRGPGLQRRDRRPAARGGHGTGVVEQLQHEGAGPPLHRSGRAVQLDEYELLPGVRTERDQLDDDGRCVRLPIGFQCAVRDVRRRRPRAAADRLYELSQQPGHDPHQQWRPVRRPGLLHGGRRRGQRRGARPDRHPGEHHRRDIRARSSGAR